MADQSKDPKTGRFLTGNPGRKRGSLNRRARFWLDLETQGQDRIKTVVLKMLDMAEQGDTKAADLMLARFMPARRNRALPIRLPTISTSAGLSAAYDATVEALGRGLIDPGEAVQIGQLLEGQRRNLEGSDTLQRLKAIEARLATGGHE